MWSRFISSLYAERKRDVQRKRKEMERIRTETRASITHPPLLWWGDASHRILLMPRLKYEWLSRGRGGHAVLGAQLLCLLFRG